jgi:uncharacterized protein (DUF58 family)
MTRQSVATPTASPYVNLRALDALRRLRFTTRQRIEGAFSGCHRSRQRGGAGEFVDYREYVEGEDLRRLDWKVLARSGRAYVRLYLDETNLLATLAIDASSSMLYNAKRGKDRTGSKLEYAQYLAASLPHLITSQQDQAGLALLAEDLEVYLPPASLSAHVAQIQEHIAGIQPQPQTDLARGLRTLFGQVHRRGVLLLMSDFLEADLNHVFSSIRLFRHQYWEVVILHLIHPQEERLPAGTAFRFEGLENDGCIDCSPADVAAEYEKKFAQHVAAVRMPALSCGCDYRRVSTATPYLEPLRTFLIERSA